MSNHRQMGFVAAAAALLAAAPLATIFVQWTWLVQSIITITMIAAVAFLVRSLQAPVWAQGLGMLGALLIALTWMFPSGGELLAVIPAPSTFAHFGQLLNESVQDMRSYRVPVSDTTPLLFAALLGVGTVAIIVDLLSVGLRRPALAGLPMLAIYSVPVAVHADSVSALPFVIGALGFLWLLVADNVNRVRSFGRRFTGEGRDIDVWEPSPLAAAGRRLAVVGIGLAVLLPVAVPGMTGGLLASWTGTGGNGTGGDGRGGPGRINLFAALSGELNRSEKTELVKVTTDDSNPFYLRFAVADELRPDGFDVRNPAGRPLTRPLPDPRHRPDMGIVRTQHQANVEIIGNFNMPLLPIYTDPVSMDGLDSHWLYDATMQIVFSTSALSKGKKYSFTYVHSRYTPKVLQAAQPLPAGHLFREQFTAVPPVREVQELVGRLIGGETTEYGKVRAIYDHFSRENGFTYSLRTEGGTSGQDIVNFLTTKSGFCQQYAAAMAWLVRAAGIPARVAFGFTNGNNRRDGAHILTNLNLHAWTEVYFDGIGWVPFDATPAASVPGSTRSAWAPDIDQPDPLSPSAAPSEESDVGPSAGPGGPDRPDRDFDSGVLGGGELAGPRKSTWPWWLAVGLVGAVGLLLIPAFSRVLLRRRRYARSATTSQATVRSDGLGADGTSGNDAERARGAANAAWSELLDTLTDFRVPVDASETPRATADRLTGELAAGAATEAVRRLGRAEEQARYARAPLPGAGLSEALAAVRGALIAGADRRTRMIALLLPPSVLHRWWSRIVDAWTQLVTRRAQVRERLLRWSPRRLLSGRAR